MIVRIYYKKWRKGRDKEYEHIVLENKFRFNLWGPRKYKDVKRKKLSKLDMLKLFSINLLKEGNTLKNPRWVLMEDKSEIALASKI